MHTSLRSDPRPAHLVLADGTSFTGTAFGATATAEGEVIFNTSMTGYPELLTDPSYRRQILSLTYPEIGNYGVCRRDFESERVQPAALVVRALSPTVSSWRSDIDLDGWLKEAGIPGIAGIDTRALVRRLRIGGTPMGIVSTDPKVDVEALRERARALAGMAGCELTSQVTCEKPYVFDEGLVDDAGKKMSSAPVRHHVVAFDFGMKKNMARLLVHHGCKVTVVPATATTAEVLAMKPDGVLLSNGPGDPSTLQDVVDAVRGLVSKVPIFGICMGHQILGQALGASTYKTKFGHRGANQPVITRDRSRVLITSQNHGFAVKPAELKDGHDSLNNLSDESNEGIDAPERWAFSVQYHPEAAPGPHDASVHFDQFVSLMDAFKAQQHAKSTTAKKSVA